MKKWILIFILFLSVLPANAGGPNSVCTTPVLTYVNFITNAAANPSYLAGRLFYDKNEGVLAFMPIIDGPVLQIGQEQWVWAYNNTGAAIANGKAVYIDSALVGIVPEAKLAKADAAATADVIAVATHDIADGAIGFFTTLGKCSAIDTTAWSAGDKLYLSTATAGELVNTIPTTGYVIEVAKVLTDAVSGAIYVAPKVSGSLVDARFAGSVTIRGGFGAFVTRGYPYTNLSNDATVNPFGTTDLRRGSAYIHVDNGSQGHGAMFLLSPSAGSGDATVTKIGGSEVATAGFSHTKDTPNLINVYLEAGVLTIQNKAGATKLMSAWYNGVFP